MRILHVSPSYYPAVTFGGPIRSVHELNKALVERGITVDVLTTTAGITSEALPKRNVWNKLDGVAVMYLSFLGYIHYNFSFSVFFKLRKLVPTYDIIHITAVWNFPVWAASFWCRWYSKPYIISPRGTIYPETMALGLQFFKKVYYQLIAKVCLKHASGIHYTTKDELERVTKFLRLTTATRVIANGITLSNPNEITPEGNLLPEGILDNPYILFLGRVHPKKGLDVLFKAFAEFRKAHPECTLVVAGPDEIRYSTDLLKLAAALQIVPNVTFVGNVTGAAKEAYFRNARFFVLTSYSENFGMSVVEALSYGCPVLVSNKVGLYEDVLEHQAGIVTGLEVPEIVAGMEQLYAGIRVPEMVQNGYSLVLEKYAINAIAAQFEEWYTEILGKSVV